MDKNQLSNSLILLILFVGIINNVNALFWCEENSGNSERNKVIIKVKCYEEYEGMKGRNCQQNHFSIEHVGNTVNPIKILPGGHS